MAAIRKPKKVPISTALNSRFVDIQRTVASRVAGWKSSANHVVITTHGKHPRNSFEA
jgi:hypothetical protein